MKKSDKRQTSTDQEENEMDSSMFLATQNKALVLEMNRYKRKISEARKELELMRSKSREMEALVSMIQRAWSQLDVDSSLLLDALGDSDMVIDENEKFQIVNLFLQAGSKLNDINAMNMNNVMQPMMIDEWSSTKEIEAEKKNTLESISTTNLINPSNESDMNIDEESKKEETLESKLEAQLRSHTSFTMALLERLCIFISEVGLFQKSPDISESLGRCKKIHAERILLENTIEKLSCNIVELSASIQTLRHDKAKCDRQIDQLQEEIQNLKKSSQSIVSESIDMTTASIPSAAADTINSMAINKEKQALQDAYETKIAILEKQLAESENAKAKVEMTLTERLARPLAQTEAQIADMRQSMEDVRSQSKQRVNGLIAEGIAFQERIFSYEVALAELEANFTSKIQQLVDATQSEITRITEEKVQLQWKISNLLSELEVSKSYKDQIQEYNTRETLMQGDIKRLDGTIQKLSSELNLLQKNLDESRKRELHLESILKEKEIIIDDQQLQVIEEDQKHDLSQLVLRDAQARTVEIQKELEFMKTSMDDLILEIESASAEERKALSQVTRLLEQVNDSQIVQKGVLDENLKLQDSTVEANQRVEEMKAKVESCEIALKQQEKVVSSLRSHESVLRSEMNDLKKNLQIANANQHEKEQLLEEVNQKLKSSESIIAAAKKCNSDLQSRCVELTKRLESERKTRMECQRLLKTKKVDKINESETSNLPSTTSTTTLGKEDAEMLDITLTMLRCSVCRDRFKEVALTRCFHLFCKECIDENIRNRNRKCPACGEKFGQDDVRQIFYTM